MAASPLTFDGIPATGVAPPDTVGDVGPKHYIQMVNISFAIYDKSGSLLAGPSPINALWAGFGGPCEANNNGDPIVRYDQLADRWVLTQFAFFAGRECIAVSRTSDPVAGGWYLYEFPTPSTPDYPKVGVWPDGYYMGTQRGFPGGGLDVFAFDRVKMLSGLPAGQVQFFVPAPSLFLQPSDLDGPAPPTGTPNIFVRHVDGDQFGGADRLEMFAFRVNWGNPALSTFTAMPSIPVTPYDAVLCANPFFGTCVPQPGTAQRLEGLTVWLMWRLQYRNFGTHESLVTNHTIDINSSDRAGIRWYRAAENRRRRLDTVPGGDVRPRRRRTGSRRRPSSLDGEHRHEQGWQHRSGLQRVEQHVVSEHPLRKSRRDGPRGSTTAARSDTDRRSRFADGNVALGQLQLDGCRSRR